MKKKVTILGCGSSVGVPRIDNYWGNCDKKNPKNYRMRCSLLIEKGNNCVLVDTSPDLKQQCLNNKINKINAVLYTHEHADQTHGINELRPFFWKNGKTINVYSNKRTINYLKKSFKYCFVSKKGYPAIVKSHIIKNNFLSIGNGSNKISFRAITLEHGIINTLGFIFEKTAYISDCSFIPRKAMCHLSNLNYLILDCLKYDKHPSHFNLDEALNVINILSPKRAYLTNLHSDIDYKILLKKLPRNVKPSYDGLTLNI